MLMLIVGAIGTLVLIRNFELAPPPVVPGQERSIHRCERAAERLKTEIAAHYEGAQQDLDDWLAALDREFDPELKADLNTCPGSRHQGPQVYDDIPGVHAWIQEVNPHKSWIKLVAATLPPSETQATPDGGPVHLELRLKLDSNGNVETGQAQVYDFRRQWEAATPPF